MYSTSEEIYIFLDKNYDIVIDDNKRVTFIRTTPLTQNLIDYVKALKSLHGQDYNTEIIEYDRLIEVDIFYHLINIGHLEEDKKFTDKYAMEIRDNILLEWVRQKTDGEVYIKPLSQKLKKL